MKEYVFDGLFESNRKPAKTYLGLEKLSGSRYAVCFKDSQGSPIDRGYVVILQQNDEGLFELVRSAACRPDLVRTVRGGRIYEKDRFE